MIVRFWIAAFASVVALAGAFSTQAQAPASGGGLDGVTVIGEAKAEARPDLFEIDLSVSAASELTTDAIVKYRDARQRVLDAFDGLQLENVEVLEEGLAVNRKALQFDPYYGRVMPSNDASRTEVELSRTLVVRVTGIREMEDEAILQLIGRLLDVAQDAGATIGAGSQTPVRNIYGANTGQNALVRFKLADPEPLRDQAYERAIADARARAERLAKLGGFELGPVVGIRELEPLEQKSRGPTIIYNYGTMEDEDDNDLQRPRLEPIPLEVRLEARFAIAASESEGN